MLKKFLLIAVSTSSLILPQVAFAESGDTGTMNVTLTVQSGCELAVGAGAGTSTGGTAVGALDFGTVTVYGPGKQVPDDASVVAQAGTGTAGDAGTFTINCGTGAAPELTPQIALNGGSNDGGGGQRRLANGAAMVPYDLYQDAAHTNAWVADTAVPITLVAGQAAVPIFGIAHNVATAGTVDGAYIDTVTLTLTY